MTITRAWPVTGALVAILALAGCDTIGDPFEAVRKKKQAPDEFQVLAHEKLRVPSTMTLPPPKPGAESPREPDAQSQAIAALTGGGTEAGLAEPAGSARVSRGEQLLVSAAIESANAPADPSGIRSQLEQERAEAEANKPYEPPSLAELFGYGAGQDYDPESVIDPVAESLRLQTAGVTAPMNPDAAPPEDLEAGGVRTAGDVEFYPEEGKDGAREPFANMRMSREQENPKRFRLGSGDLDLDEEDERRLPKK